MSNIYECITSFRYGIEVGKRKELVRCKDCKYCVKETNGELYCDILAVGYEPLGSKKVNADWFCADGERKLHYNMSCSTCSKCKWIRNSAFSGTTTLTEKQLYAKNGFCSTYEPKEEAQVTPQPHPCKECNKYGCDVHCPYYGK